MLPTTFALMMAGDLQWEILDDGSVVIANCAELLSYAASKEKQLDAIQAFVSGTDTFICFMEKEWEGTACQLFTLEHQMCLHSTT